MPVPVTATSPPTSTTGTGVSVGVAVAAGVLVRVGVGGTVAVGASVGLVVGVGSGLSLSAKPLIWHRPTTDTSTSDSAISSCHRDEVRTHRTRFSSDCLAAFCGSVGEASCILPVRVESCDMSAIPPVVTCLPSERCRHLLSCQAIEKLFQR